MLRVKLNIQRFASGTVNFNENSGFTGRIVWSSSSNGVSANSSKVTGSLQIRKTNGQTTWGTFSYGYRVASKTQFTNYDGSVGSDWVTVSTLTDSAYPHNSDGTGKCTIEGYVNGPTGTSLEGVTVSGSKQVTLDKINRYATITSAPNFNDEENPTITYSNPAGNSVTSLQVCIADTTGNTIYVPYRDISKTGSSYTFELTENERTALRNATPNSNTLNVRFYVKTVISGSTFHQYSTKTLSIVNANPIFSNFEFEDTNSTTLALTGNNQNNINGYSNIKATISTLNKATAQKGATMSKYRFVINDKTIDILYSDSASVNGTITNAPSGTFQVYAIDSRNNSTLITKLANQVINYTPLSLDTSSKVVRTNGGVGANANLSYSGEIWNNSFGQVSNSIQSAEYQYKETGSSTWITFADFVQAGVTPTNITPTLSNNTFSFNNIVRSIDSANSYEFELQKSYDFRILISDKLSSSTMQLTPMASAIPNISFADDGVGIMCDYDESLGGLLQVGGASFDIEEYSSSEIKTNKIYIDENNNKYNIYRKTIKGTLPTISGSGVNSANISHNISNYKAVININGKVIQKSTNNEYIFPVLASSGHMFTIYQVSSSYIILRSYNESWTANNWNYEFNIEYIKTTS